VVLLRRVRASHRRGGHQKHDPMWTTSAVDYFADLLVLHTSPSINHTSAVEDSSGLITSLILSSVLPPSVPQVCINSKSSRGAASYLKMAGATVGKGVATVAFALFTVFQYLLLVAYISQGGSLLRNFLEIFQGMDLESVIVHEMDSLGAPVVFASLMGLLLTLGTPKALESVNNAVVLCVVGTFSLLLAAGMQKIDVSLLNHVEVDKLRKWDHSREGIRPSWADRYKAGKMRGVDRMGC
jgi:hypothetical protein